MKRTKDFNTNKGITLIALVITIIVMLILVGVTISMAVNGGLFDYAGKATGETKNALNAEQELANGGIEVDGVWYNSIDEYLNKDKDNNVEKISKEQSYVGYYADVDGDGTVDGVIYADLAFSKEGYYKEETGLKDYYICGEYDDGGYFNLDVGYVLKAIGEGKDRFYVMALEDSTTGDYSTFYWYYNAFEKMTDYKTATSSAFGKGRTNTEKIKEYWEQDEESPYGAQNSRDLWTLIEEDSPWFLPSAKEWYAFEETFGIYNTNNESDTYEDFGLSNGYWTSSQSGEWGAYPGCANDSSEVGVLGGDVYALGHVRLSATY